MDETLYLLIVSWCSIRKNSLGQLSRESPSLQQKSGGDENVPHPKYNLMEETTAKIGKGNQETNISHLPILLKVITIKFHLIHPAGL
jgi:hypothetical protein